MTKFEKTARNILKTIVYPILALIVATVMLLGVVPEVVTWIWKKEKKPKIKKDCRKLVDEFANKPLVIKANDPIDLEMAFKEGYNQCLKDEGLVGEENQGKYL